MIFAPLWNLASSLWAQNFVCLEAKLDFKYGYVPKMLWVSQSYLQRSPPQDVFQNDILCCIMLSGELLMGPEMPSMSRRINKIVNWSRAGHWIGKCKETSHNENAGVYADLPPKMLNVHAEMPNFPPPKMLYLFPKNAELPPKLGKVFLAIWKKRIPISGIEVFTLTRQGKHIGTQGIRAW